MNPRGHKAALSLPTAGHRDRAGGPQWGACGHQVPKRITSRQVLLWGLTPGESGDSVSCRQWGWVTQAGYCEASHGLCRAHTYTWPHTHTDKCHMQTWAHPCLRAQPGLRPRVVVRHLVPPSPSSGSLAALLKKPLPAPPPPTGSTENKQARPS